MTGLIATHPGKKIQEIVTEQAKDQVKPFAKVAYSITYALPGQVGFCVPRIAEDPKYLRRLEALLEAEHCLTSKQANTAAGSIVITYQTGTMSDFEMRSHFASLIQSANDHVVLATQQSAEKLVNSHSQPQSVAHTNKTNQQAMKTAKVAFSIAHTIPGRVRFRVPRIAQDSKYVQRLERLLKAEPWVTSERVNRAAKSIVITYKYGMIQNSQKQASLKSSVFEKAVCHLVSLIQSANEPAFALT